MTPLELEANLARFLRRNASAHRCRCAGSSATPRASRRRPSRSTPSSAARPARYVAKREPVAGLLEPYDLEPEFRVLHALSGADVPSPPTPWFSDDPRVLERPFYVMERLPGEVPLPTAGRERQRALHAGRARGARAAGRRGARAPARRRLAQRGFDFLGAPAAGRAARPSASSRAGRRASRARASRRRRCSPTRSRWLRAHLPATPTRSRSCTATTASATCSSSSAATRDAARRPRLGDGAPRRPARGSRLVQLRALARGHALRRRDARAGGVRRRLRRAPPAAPSTRSACTSTTCSRSSR